MRVVPVLAALLLVPLAAARAPDEDYREEARSLLLAMDGSVLRARVATVEHAFGDRDARATAHVMRVEGERLGLLVAQLDGLHPPPGHARAHEVLRQSAAWFADAVAALEACYRHDDDDACRAGHVRVSWAQTYRALSARVFS